MSVPAAPGVETGSAADRLQRWGLKTLGDLAGLPARPLSERLGQGGVMWQRLARGEDLQPLVSTEPEVPIEEALDLEWPAEGLEPLSFVLARICEPIAERLAALDLAAVVLRLSCRLVSRETTRGLQLRRRCATPWCGPAAHPSRTRSPASIV
jgi:protein ImuB